MSLYVDILFGKFSLNSSLPLFKYLAKLPRTISSSSFEIRKHTQSLRLIRLYQLKLKRLLI